MSVVAALDLAFVAILVFCKGPCGRSLSEYLPWFITIAFLLNYACFAIFFATLVPDWPQDSGVGEAGQDMYVVMTSGRYVLLYQLTRVFVLPFVVFGISYGCRCLRLDLQLLVFHFSMLLFLPLYHVL